MISGEIGFIFHWGLYSKPAYDDIKSVRSRSLFNGSEWILERIKPDPIKVDKDGNLKKPYRTISGSSQAKNHFAEVYGSDDMVERYYGFAQDLDINADIIGAWLDICVAFRAKYVLLTSKHHDGFCLWNTKTTDLKHSVDVVQIFKEQAEIRGLEFGLYYSWMEFLKPNTIPFFSSTCIPQVRELATYKPKYIFFDGDWVFTQKAIFKEIDALVEMLNNQGCLVNDRLGKREPEKANYRVFNDRFIPEEPLENWQHINTIGLSWGRNKEQESKDYKSGQELFNLGCKVTEMGGSLLFNIGPDHKGDIDPFELKSLEEFYEILTQDEP